MACTCENCCKNYETCELAHFPNVDTRILAMSCDEFEHKEEDDELFEEEE